MGKMVLLVVAEVVQVALLFGTIQVETLVDFL